MFGQTFDPRDLVTIGVLVVLEGVLSIDNALVLGLLARRLPRALQGRALTYGLGGAFLFRGIAIAAAAWLLRWHFVKLLGGLYLVWVAGKHFFDRGGASPARAEPSQSAASADFTSGAEAHPPPPAAPPVTPAPRHRGRVDYAHARSTHTLAFWMAVATIELTDVAFAVDSIVAAIGIVGPPPESGQRHPKLWVVFAGGMLGVVLMRYAARLFIILLEKFPRFETSAYLLVIVIGGKLLLDYGVNAPRREPRLDFHDVTDPAFWGFWAAMIACFLIGFIPHRHPATGDPAPGRGRRE